MYTTCIYTYIGLMYISGAVYVSQVKLCKYKTMLLLSKCPHSQVLLISNFYVICRFAEESPLNYVSMHVNLSQCIIFYELITCVRENRSAIITTSVKQKQSKI